MEELDLKKIWADGQAGISKHQMVSREEIDLFRQTQSRDVSSSMHRLITFDILLKVAVALGYVTFIILLEGQISVQWISGLLALTCLGMVLEEVRFLKALAKIDESGSILETLRKKIDFHERYYRKYILRSAVTSPMLILCGFFFYEMLKYEKVNMGFPWETPVPYIFLIIGFLISYFASRPFYRIRLEELNNCLEVLDDQYKAYSTIQYQRKRKRNLIILFLMISLLGILIFLVLIWMR